MGPGVEPVGLRTAPRKFSTQFYEVLESIKLNHKNARSFRASWFNNRGLAPDPATGKAPKNEDGLHQPGMRLDGPISIPRLFNGRDKAFFLQLRAVALAGADSKNRSMCVRASVGPPPSVKAAGAAAAFGAGGRRGLRAGCDRAGDCGGKLVIVGRIDGAQVEYDEVVFDARDYRRGQSAEP